jgi:hypothetical protein
MRNTHTYVTLEISAAGYDEIAKKLRDADYGHCFNSSGEIDMTGIAVVRAASVRGCAFCSSAATFPDVDLCDHCAAKFAAKLKTLPDWPLARTEGRSAEHHTEGSAKTS